MKLLTNNLLNSSKELTEFGGILLNHTRAGPLRVVGKALHIISSGTPWRCIVVLKVAMWSKGSCVPLYESREGNLNFGGRGWPLMVAVKGESVLWTKFLQDSPFSCSLSFLPWLSSFGPSLLSSVAPFVKWYLLTDFQFQHFLYHHDSVFVLLLHALHVSAFSN